MGLKSMASWIYVFSKFTPEALLFEALIICLLCASYAAFWVLRKRKYGVLGPDTPAYAVKSYLSQLILDAEQMRIQLFGLLSGAGIDPNAIAALRAASAGATAGTSPLLANLSAAATAQISAAALAADPALGPKLAALEAKMAEQAKALETINGEKTRVEKELVEIRSGKGGTPGAPAAAVDDKLAEKVKMLEAKLAEYSVIEDDLANLKRLQQENSQLKAQLGGKAAPIAEVAAAAAGKAAAPGAKAPATAAAASLTEVTQAAEAPSAGEPALTETPAEASGQAAAEVAAAGAVAATDAAIAEAAAAGGGAPAAGTVTEPAAADPATITEAPGEAPIASPTGDAGFEGLVDQVEQSLTATPPAAEPAAGASVTDAAAQEAANPAAAAAANRGAASAPSEKSDADLVAEFEKMLNS